MTGKDKFIYVFLCIITLGIYPLTIKNRKAQSTSNELSVQEKVTVNVKKLQEALGGEGNVAGTEYTQTKIKIYLTKRDKANIEDIKALKGISGVFASSKYVTIIVGKQAKVLSEKI